MKKPERINFATEDEYDMKMVAYIEHLRHKEWIKSGGRKALILWVVALGTLVGGVLIADFILKYGIL